MLNALQQESTMDFSNRMASFIDQNHVPLRMSSYQEDSKVNNSFYVLDDKHNKHFLGEISFKDSSNDYDYFIDVEVIHLLQKKGVI